MKRWQYLVLIWVPPVVGALAAMGLSIGCYRFGRNDAVDAYRRECIGVEKKHRGEFTLLYVDEYRASNCEEAIRLIWGEGAVRPWLAEREKLEPRPSSPDDARPWVPKAKP